MELVATCAVTLDGYAAKSRSPADSLPGRDARGSAAIDKTTSGCLLVDQVGPMISRTARRTTCGGDHGAMTYVQD